MAEGFVMMACGYQGPGTYQHYKGGLYRIIGLAIHTETKVPMVVYTREAGVLPDVEMFVRPLVMFNERVDGVGGTAIDGTPRFTRVG